MSGAWRFWKSSLSRTRTSDKPEHQTELRPQTSGFGGSGRQVLKHASLLARHPLEKHPMPNTRTANAVRQLRLAPLDDSGMRVRKHLLQFDGLGVRDLHFFGDDLYILAGQAAV